MDGSRRALAGTLWPGTARAQRRRSDRGLDHRSGCRSHKRADPVGATGSAGFRAELGPRRGTPSAPTAPRRHSRTSSMGPSWDMIDGRPTSTCPSTGARGGDSSGRPAGHGPAPSRNGDGLRGGARVGRPRGRGRPFRSGSRTNNTPRSGRATCSSGSPRAALAGGWRCRAPRRRSWRPRPPRRPRRPTGPSTPTASTVPAGRSPWARACGCPIRSTASVARTRTPPRAGSPSTPPPPTPRRRRPVSHLRGGHQRGLRARQLHPGQRGLPAEVQPAHRDREPVGRAWLIGAGGGHQAHRDGAGPGRRPGLDQERQDRADRQPRHPLARRCRRSAPPPTGAAPAAWPSPTPPTAPRRRRCTSPSAGASRRSPTPRLHRRLHREHDRHRSADDRQRQADPVGDARRRRRDPRGPVRGQVGPARLRAQGHDRQVHREHRHGRRPLHRHVAPDRKPQPGRASATSRSTPPAARSPATTPPTAAPTARSPPSSHANPPHGAPPPNGPPHGGPFRLVRT
jgi:hypothetical protein